MRLINKRYRIISKITDLKNGIYYNVKDIYDKKNKTLKFFNSDKYSNNELIQFKNEFIKRSNLDIPCFNEVDDFSQIWNIDDNDLNSDYLFYTIKNDFRGTKLTNYKFENRNDKLYIFKKIDFCLKYLHRNGFYHGYLTDENIEILDGKNILFTKFNIHGSKEKDLGEYDRILKKYNLKKNDMKNIKICKKEIFDFLKQNFSFKLNFNDQLKNNLTKKFREILSKQKSAIFNLTNFDKDYYIAANKYLKSILLTKNYKVFSVEGSADILELLKKFVRDVNKHKQFSKFIKENKDFVKMIFNQKIINLNLKKIFAFIRNLVEKMSLKEKIAIIFNDFNSIKDERIEYLKDIINEYSGNKILLLMNDNKLQLEDSLSNDNFVYIKYGVSPVKEDFSKHNLRKLLNLFYFIDINKKLKVLKKHNYYDINKIISYIINIYSKKPEKGSEILNEDTLTELIQSEYYLIDFYYNKDYKRLLSFISLMHRPLPMHYLKRIENNVDKKIKTLIDAKILKFNQKKFLTFYDINYGEYLENKFKKQEKEFKTKIHNKIIQVYEKNLKKLGKMELIALAFNYYYVDSHNKLKELLLNYFIKNYQINRSFLKSKIEELLKSLMSNLNKIEDSNKNIRAVYLLTNTLFKNTEDIKERKNHLKAIEKLYITDRKIKFIIIKELFKIYYKLNDKGKLDEYFNKASKLLPYLEFIDQIYVYNMLIDYYFNQNQPSMVKKMCRLIMSKIYKKKDKYPYMYLNILNKMARYYSSRNEPLKQLNTYKLLLKRSKGYKFHRYTMIAHNSIGIYYVHMGNHKKARKHFSKILQLAGKIYDYDFLITGNINIAMVNQNFDEVKSYYLKALKYAEKTNKYDNILLILTNLFEIISDKKLYNLIKKHEEKIKDREYLLANFRQYGHFYYTIILLLMRINKMDRIYEYYEILNNLDITEKNQYYPYYRLLILVYEKLMGNVAVNYEKIKNLMYDMPSYFLERYVEIIFVWFYTNFSDKQKSDWLDSIYNQLEKENFENYKLRVKALLQIKTRGMDEKYLEDVKNIKFDLQEYFDIYLYIYFSLNIVYFNKKKGNNFLASLNYILIYFKNFYTKFNNKNLFDLTVFSSLYDNFEEYFPSYFESYFLNNKKMDYTPDNIDKYLDNTHFYKEEKSKNFIKNLLSQTLDTCKYDRAIFYNIQNNKVKNKIKVVKNKLLFVNNKKEYFHQYFKNLGKNIIVEKPKNNSIFQIVLIPIIEKSIFKRYEYKKKHKIDLNDIQNKYLNGVVYLDKKNSIEVKNEKIIFKFIQTYFSQYWEKYIIQRKFLKDKLTNLFLKEEFLKRSKEYINNESIENKKYSIIMADIDNFKNINDTFGHQKGDEVLVNIASIIQKNIRPFDIAARYGGEEFIVGLENTDLYAAEMIAERIRNKIEKKDLMKSIRNLTISMGVASYPRDSILLTELISKADLRLYRAKRQGKNQVCKI